MSESHTASGEAAVRASDAERDRAAEVLRAAYAEGRLTRDELDQRVEAAYAARTRASLRDLTSDLPGAVPAGATGYDRPPGADLPLADPQRWASTPVRLCVLLCLFFCFPPAGIGYGIYWIVTALRRAQPATREPSDGGSPDLALTQPPRAGSGT